jgi:hypothetical protein
LLPAIMGAGVSGPCSLLAAMEEDKSLFSIQYVR